MSSNKTVLYGAGKNVVTQLIEGKLWGLDPVCFCDADERKQGTVYIGLPVFSLDEVLKEYGNEAIFYITLDTPLRYDVQEYLVNLGIEKDRIINYESVQKYRSCHYLRTWMGVGDHSIVSCCKLEKVPQVFWDEVGKNLNEAIDTYIDMRDKTIVAIANGIPTVCDDCHFI